MNNFYQNYLKPHDAALEALEISVRGGARLEQDAGFDKLCELSAQVCDTGRKQYLAGNEASARSVPYFLDRLLRSYFHSI